MRNFVFLILTSGFFSLSFGVWESIGPYGGNLRALAKASSDNIIYVASNGDPTVGPSKIFRSTDSGKSWQRIGSILNWIHSLEVDPTNSDIIYAGSDQRVYKSIDGGENWVSYPVSDFYINDLAINPDLPSTIYAAGATMSGNYTYMAFFKSTDGGMNWTTIPLCPEKGYSTCLAIGHLNPSTIYVGGYAFTTSAAPKVYKSTNGGISFTDVSPGYTMDSHYLYSLAVNQNNSDHIYAGMDYGIYRSTDGGSSWILASDYEFIYSLATTPVNPDIIYAGSNESIYVSSNGGESWSNTGPGISGSRAYGLAIAKNQGTIVYVANNSGFYKTTNGGADWYESNYGLTLAMITSIGIAPSNPSILHTQFNNRFHIFGLYKSTDAGSTWTKSDTPFYCGVICDFAIHISNPDIVFAFEGAG